MSATITCFVEARYPNEHTYAILYQADSSIPLAEITRRTHLACERQDARLCQLFCLDYWPHARIPAFDTFSTPNRLK